MHTTDATTNTDDRRLLGQVRFTHNPARRTQHPATTTATARSAGVFAPAGLCIKVTGSAPRLRTVNTITNRTTGNA